MSSTSVNPSEGNAQQDAYPFDIKSDTSVNRGFASKLRSFLMGRVVETSSAALLLSLALFGFSGWNIWTIYQGFQTNITQQFRLKELTEKTIYYDEALTMSANMGASSGNLEWQNRYNSFVPKLDATIAEIIALFPEAEADFARTKDANDKLIALEDDAFKLLRKGKRTDAAAILFGKEYATQKGIYARGVELTLDKLKTAIDEQVDSYKQRLLQSGVFAGVSFPLLMLVWAISLFAIREYVRERDLAQKELLAFQTSLQQRNRDLEAVKAQLESQAWQLAAQEQVTRDESDALQEDVGHLLEVVTSVEGGDLTIQAPVSDRVTGLVADTFNRLVEELANIMAQVLKAAQQVSVGADSLEEIAGYVATNAEQQTQAVTQALNLSKQVEHSAEAAAQQLQLSNTSLRSLSEVVNDGQRAIRTLTEGTDVLRQGTDRIVQQMKTLGEFVGLAEQFVQDQNQIATQTQVLALNASLVAARAAEQQNPKQFIVAAREFEAIADQVSKLAQQTNEGLSILEQRTAQIQSVVASVDTEVQNLGGLVGGFTQGVERSNQVFDNVQTVTTEVVRSGETVAASSQQMIGVAQSTATTMQSIFELVERTTNLIQNTRNQSETMGQLSAQLLQRVEFFRLPTTYSSTTPSQLESSHQSNLEEKTIDVMSTAIAASEPTLSSPGL
jgi:methyl-accepting chemotaxis protein PixJ